jgi:hypothetical protein
MIENIQKAGNLRVIVKDCSLGEGLRWWEFWQ